MKLIHLTDIHLTRPGETIGGREPNEHFEQALAHILEHHSDADAMAITGDLSDWGDPADYERLRDRLATLPFPIGLMIGNHDDRAAFLKAFPEAGDGEGFAQGAMETEVGRLLFLDTVAGDHHGGRYCAARRRWLERQLEQDEQPIYLFMHHNPMPSHVPAMDEIGLLDGAAFRGLIGQWRDRIRHIFHGHTHLAMTGAVHGVPVASLRGSNNALWPNFTEREQIAVSDLSPAYAVAFLELDHAAIHMIDFTYDRPIPFVTAASHDDWREARAERLAGG